MTFVGKIFVVLQLVLSVCFMAFAGAVYTAETNWREEAGNLNEQIAQIRQQLNEANQAMEKYKTTTTTTINDLKEDKALLGGQKETLSAQLARAEDDLQAARASVDQQTALANIAQEQAQFRKDETHRLRDANARLHTTINDMQAKVRGLEDTVFNKDTKIANIQDRHSAVVDELATYRSILLSENMSLNPEDYQNLGGVGEPPPAVIGQVLNTQVSNATGTEFVSISLGSDDGFKKGHELTVYRGGDYLGKLKLVSVQADKAVGTMIPRSSPRNSDIQKGDNVRP